LRSSLWSAAREDALKAAADKAKAEAELKAKEDEARRIEAEQVTSMLFVCM
jgi:hypothetical protein